jgi:hypothetical protein
MVTLDSDYVSYASFFGRLFGPILIFDRDVPAQIHFTLTSIELNQNCLKRCHSIYVFYMRI